ncbi:MAG: S26 family signal peptidase [Methanomassiliicoccales archaeon]|nr:MAG: S26 family signal peptidase [Methanomassiliicoccales archaeon]
MVTAKKVWDEVRSFVITIAVFLIIIGALFLYSGIWPPFVVVESGSMQHSDDRSKIGIMDTGDLILVRELGEDGGIVTYVEGYSTGYRTFGDYGDVVMYKRDGTDRFTPVIHRAIVLLEFNSTSGSYDVPSLANLPNEKWSHDGASDGRWWDLDGTLYIYGVGYKKETLEIHLDDLLSYGRGGYITKGDHNDVIDQNPQAPISTGPVLEEWVIGTAKAELPWFGLIKLWFSGQYRPYGPGVPDNSWTALFLTIALMVLVPIAVEVGDVLLKRRGIDVVARIRSKVPWTKKRPKRP